jgi:hypothetical protein
MPRGRIDQERMTDEVCPACGYVRQYPYCLDKYHDDGTKNNPVYDKLQETLNRINGSWGSF